MRLIRGGPLPNEHPDFPIVRRIEVALLEKCRGIANLRRDLPALMRQAIDEVIDAPRTGRVFASELEKTEKTYIGTKAEILIRNYFRLPKGILDLRIDGLDVDVKNTLGQTWMIPREAIGKPCIVVASDEPKRTFFFGIFIAKPDHLTAGLNQDKKSSVSVEGHRNIHWLLENEQYPKSFWSLIGEDATQQIMRGGSGTERVARLFQCVQRRPIHRDIVQAVAQQKDYMKRLRKNGGARDTLAIEGVAILSGTYDGELIRLLGIPPISRDELISVTANSPEEALLLRPKLV